MNPCLLHYCRVCNIQLNSCRQAKIHSEGKKHEKRLSYLKFCLESSKDWYTAHLAKTDFEKNWNPATRMSKPWYFRPKVIGKPYMKILPWRKFCFRKPSWVFNKIPLELKSTALPTASLGRKISGLNVVFEIICWYTQTFAPEIFLPNWAVDSAVCFRS